MLLDLSDLSRILSEKVACMDCRFHDSTHKVIAGADLGGARQVSFEPPFC